jgi:hypothetical protein
MFGWYRGYLGDGDARSGSTVAQINAVEALIQGPIQAVAIGGGINASLTGLGRHLFVKVPLIPNGGSLTTAATTGYTTMWNTVVDQLIAQSRNNADTTLQPGWEGSGGNSWGGIGSVDPVTGTFGTKANYVAAYRKCVDTMVARGLSSAVTLDWNVMSGGMSTTQLAQMDPGGSYRHSVGWDGYYGNPDPGTYNRNSAQAIWDNEMLRDLTTVQTYARANGLRAGMGEFGWVVAAPGDTTSNAYTYRPAQSAIFDRLMYEFMKANANTWAFVLRFGQNQYDVNGNISEDNQPIYLGTNPTLQTYPKLKNTDARGPAYLTTSPQWTPVILQPFLDYWGGSAGRGGGTLTYTAPVTPPSTAPGVVTHLTKNPRHRRGWIKG